MGDKTKKPDLYLIEGKALAKQGKTPSKHLEETVPYNNRQRITAKQLGFAQSVVSGATLTDAYKENYDTSNSKDQTIWTNACLLASNPKVKSRIQELYAELDVDRSNIEARRREYVLIGLQKEAEDQENGGARIRALELLGKTIAMFTDKVETGDNDDRTADELEQEILQKLNRMNNARLIGEGTGD
jgi:hypothetical protein